MSYFPAESRLNYVMSSGLRKTCVVLMSLGLALTVLQVFFSWEGEGDKSGNKVGDGNGKGHEVVHEAAKPTQELSGDASAKTGEHVSASAASNSKASPDEHHSVYSNPRLFLSIHLALLIALPLALGGIYFIAFNHVSGSVWNVSVRRLAEQTFWYLPVVLVMMGIVFWGAGDVFHHWTHAPADDHLIAWKRPWLSLPFFIGRNIFFVLLWFCFGWILWKKSLAQDKDSQFEHSKSMAKYSAIFLVVFALSYSANSWDLSLSLEPHWFSTLWSVYIFSGTVLTIFAALILWVCYLKSKGYYGNILNENHFHDLGKYLWGHTIFWAYMAVSQYMLIWYAAIPEETYFYKTRTEGGWFYVSLGLVFVRFVLPFFLMIKRKSKRNFRYMAVMACLILVGQVWDMYWIAYPTLFHGHFVWFSWQELGPLLFVAGSYIFVIGKALQKQCLIPKNDPRLEKCFHFHQ